MSSHLISLVIVIYKMFIFAFFLNFPFLQAQALDIKGFGYRTNTFFIDLNITYTLRKFSTIKKIKRLKGKSDDVLTTQGWHTIDTSPCLEFVRVSIYYSMLNLL